MGNSSQLIFVIPLAHCLSPRLWVLGIQLVLIKEFLNLMFSDLPAATWTLRFSSLLRYFWCFPQRPCS